VQRLHHIYQHLSSLAPTALRDQNVKLGLKSRSCYKVNGSQIKVNLDGSTFKFLGWGIVSSFGLLNTVEYPQHLISILPGYMRQTLNACSKEIASWESACHAHKILFMKRYNQQTCRLKATPAAKTVRDALKWTYVECCTRL